MSGAVAKKELNPLAKFYKDSTDLIVKCKKPDAKGAYVCAACARRPLCALAVGLMRVWRLLRPARIPPPAALLPRFRMGLLKVVQGLSDSPCPVLFSQSFQRSPWQRVLVS